MRCQFPGAKAVELRCQNIFLTSIVGSPLSRLSWRIILALAKMSLRGMGEDIRQRVRMILPVARYKTSSDQ